MKRFSTILLSAAVSVASFAQPQLSEKNIESVLKAMSLEEKAQLLVGSIEGMNYTGGAYASNWRSSWLPACSRSCRTNQHHSPSGHSAHSSG